MRINKNIRFGKTSFGNKDGNDYKHVLSSSFKVAPEAVSGSIHCLCNHLSAFGGDFFVEPNKIEFRKVFGKFGDLGETKNFVVLATVCSMLLLFTIGLIFTRRADRRDKEKVSSQSNLHCKLCCVMTVS